jgi:hypothetical protein
MAVEMVEAAAVVARAVSNPGGRVGGWVAMGGITRTPK